MNSWRITLGLALIITGANIHNLAKFLLNFEVIQNTERFTVMFLLDHLKQASFSATLLLASILVIFGIAEVYFLFALWHDKKEGAIGLFAMQILWMFAEILFFAKFFLASTLILWIINLVILVLLARLIIKKQEHIKNFKF